MASLAGAFCICALFPTCIGFTVCRLRLRACIRAGMNDLLLPFFAVFLSPYTGVRR